MKYIIAIVVIAAAVFTVGSLQGQVATPNLFINSEFENGTAGAPVNWTPGQWSNGVSVFTYPVAGVSGNALRTEALTVGQGDGLYWFGGYFPVTPGTVYYYADQYRSNAVTYVAVEYRMTNGSYLFQNIDLAPARDEWTKFQGTFTVPAGAVDMTILRVLNRVGYVEMDNVELRTVAGTDPFVFSQGMVTFTFDDGLKSAATNAIPRLNKAKLKGTFYIIEDALSQRWTDYMTIRDVRTLNRQGHEVGSHSKSHQNTSQLTPAQMYTEISGSRARLEEMGFHDVVTFAYPFGDFSAATDEAVRWAGYYGSRTVERGFNKTTTDPYFLKVQAVTSATTVEEAKAWIDQAVREKTWLVIMFHGIDTTNGSDSMTPEKFQGVLDYVVQKKVPVRTMGQVLSAYYR